MLSAKITYQKLLMKRALKILDDIEEAKALFGGIDDKYVEEKQTEYKELYAEVMKLLFVNIATITTSRIEKSFEDVAKIETATVPG